MNKEIIIKSAALGTTSLIVEFVLSGETLETNLNIASLVRYAVILGKEERVSYNPIELVSDCVHDMALIERYILHLDKGGNLKTTINTELV